MDTRTNSKDQLRPTYDVAVIGGGAAGLAGAVALGRARRSVLVIDAGSPRNAPAGHVHNYLGHEGTEPHALLAIGRDEVRTYGGEIETGEVTGVERLASGRFRVTRREGSPVEARRLLVTTGLVDELPDVQGLAERWGQEVLHCPYCHGWEVQDQAVAVLATSPMAAQQALLWRQWTADLTLILHDAAAPTEEEAAQLAALGVEVVEGAARSVELTDGVVSGVRLDDGRLVACQAIVVRPRFTAQADLLVQLGLPIAEQRHGTDLIGTYVASDPTGATEVPGVWVAGNVANLTAQVISSAAAGLLAAATINLDLLTEDARAAVESASRPEPDHAEQRRRGTSLTPVG